MLPRVRDIRRAGAAALDLAWCACGRYDGYWERGVKPWDVAAGQLIAARAGLSVVTLPARGPDPAGLLVAPAAVRDELLALVLGETRRSRPSRRPGRGLDSGPPRRWWNGRHDALKRHCPSGRVGSNPTRRMQSGPAVR